jgi:aldehyde dehydrogenase (NAD+)
MAALIKEAGFPAGVVNILSGYGVPAGNALAAHMDVDKVAFTGSTATGRKIMEAAAKSNLKRVSLELGGKSPSIVMPDVNIDEAVEGTHFGMFFNAGQTCCAGTRTFVHESIYDEFVAKATERAKKLQLSNVSNTPFSQGPQVDKIQHDKIMSYIETGKKEGAKLNIGGKAGTQGYYIEPTIFSDVQDHHTIAKEEIFGPVMSILKFSTMDEVIERANNTPYGLAASVFCNDITVCNYIANHLKAGTVWVNCHNILQPQAPFGGFKQSGFGRDNSEYSIIEYSQVKCITTKVAESVPAIPAARHAPAIGKATSEQTERKQGEVAH